ncbi:MAG: ATP-binding cassette domain-containing protein [Roseburia sp.]|nr:ATP-binding cassette domain-containing protein [Roseburia sp.]
MRRNKHIKYHDPFSSWFRRSRRAKLIEGFLTFLFLLACSYAASDTLSMALEQNRDGVLRFGLALTVLLAMGLPVIFLLSKWTGREQVWDCQRFREALYSRILSNGLEVSSVGSQEQLLGDISDQVAEQYQSRIPGVAEGLCIIGGATLLMCLERPGIGLLFTAMSFLQFLPVFTYERWTKKIYEESWANDEAETDWIVQGFGGIRTLKAYGMEAWFSRRYKEINERGIRTGNKSVAVGGLESVLYASIDAILRYGSYVILGLYVLHRGLPVSSLPILVMLSGYVFSSMRRLCTFFRYRATYRTAAQRLQEAFRQTPEPGEDTALEAKGISRAFGEKQVLSDVDLTVKAGQRVLLKGRNGAGKSTLIRILTGELTPDKGAVRSGMRTAIALQESPDLPETAASFLPILKKQEDWSFSRFRTHLEGLRFPEELLERPIRELSGGERKKLFLAIALARDTDLLILDEPTNHLDRESRAYLKNVLDDLACAMLICTHDPALRLSWDQTVILAGGGVENG